MFLDKKYVVNGKMFEAEDFDEPIPVHGQTQETERDEMNKPAEDAALYGILLNFLLQVFKQLRSFFSSKIEEGLSIFLEQAYRIPSR